MVTKFEIEPPIGIPALHDAYYAALQQLVDYVDKEIVANGAGSMPKDIQDSCASALVPPTQHASLVLLKFLHAHSTAKNDTEEIAAAEELKKEILAVGKEFKSMLDTHKRFATQVMGSKSVPKT